MGKAFARAAACMAAALLAVLAGCQTAKPVAPAESAIQVDGSGFSPSGGAGHDTIRLSLLFGNSETVKSWKVEIEGSGAAQKAWTGDARYLPARLDWDGKGDSGAVAPEGTYTARLSVEYAKTYEPASVTSAAFVLDLTPPSGGISVDPPQFIPAGEGVAGPVTLSIDARSALAKLESWALDIYDIAGGLVKSFSGAWPQSAVAWDGSMSNGKLVSPNMTYRAVATVKDEYGNAARFEVNVPVADVPDAGGTRVQAGSAGFSPKSDSSARSIDLAIVFGNAESVKSWELSVRHEEKGAQMSWSGEATTLPESIHWDGTTPAGTLAPEGTYTAVLSVDYGTAFKPALAKSAPFVLAVTPPTGNVSANPATITSDGEGGVEPTTFTLDAKSPVAPLQSWTLNVLDSDGRPVATFKGTWSASPFTWDGKLPGGGSASPTQAYSFVATVSDAFGNVGEIRGSLVAGGLPQAPGSVAIVPKGQGFSPTADPTSTMTLDLSYGKPSAVVSWKVAISLPELGAQKTFSGDAASAPSRLVWDGRTDRGDIAPEGLYTAALSVSYGATYAPAAARSAPFALAVTPPRCAIALSSPLFSPMEGSGPMTLTLSAGAPVARIEGWTMDIYGPDGGLFRSFSGKWPANRAVWDGKGTSGDMVESAEDYTAVAKVRDQYGNLGTATVTVPVDILVEKQGSGYRILASRIFFKPYTADYKDVSANLASQNLARLDALAAKLAKFPGYSIRIVGHAVMINWDTPALGKAEQAAILIPLSKARAEAVKQALVERGLAESRFTTQGVGASDQLVPDSNLGERWQNRRVVLYLEKEE